MNTPPRSPRCFAGFSLIEMMIVLAIASLLLGIGLPSFQQLIARQQMSTAVNGYVLGFQQARMRAVARAGQVVACPSHDGESCTGGLDWGQGWLIFDDDNHNRELDPGETVISIFQALKPSLRAESSIGRPRLVYRADGASAGSNLRVTVCHQRNLVPGRSVVVNQAGRPRTAPDELSRCTT